MYKRKSNREKTGLLSINIILTLIFTLSFFPLKIHAAEEGSLKMSKEEVRLAVGETELVNVDYSIPTGFYDLKVVVANPEVAAVCLTDNGNGKASLAIGATGKGITTIAVYRASNAAVVTYVSLKSGLAAKNQVYTEIVNNIATTTYDDRIVQYPTILHGKNDAELIVSGIVLERESGLDRLCITGTLATVDSKLPGMNTFYANFYDCGGVLLKRQAVYSRDPSVNNVMTLEWYVPEGVALITVE